MTTPQRICLLTLDVVGPIRNGGIGTAFLALAERLRDAGHHVTLLYPPAHSETDPISWWERHYRERGIDFVTLYSEGHYRDFALDAYQWLKTRHFDVIHFHEWRAPGFWLTAAKRCGLAFGATTLVCQLHSPTSWHRKNSAVFMNEPRELEVDWMERRSAEGADVVYSPSEYLLAHVEEQGWTLPARRRVLPNLLPSSFPIADAGQNGPRPVEEVVFFGRLEGRKGLPLFCQAVTALTESGDAPPAVAFLGKVGEVGTRSALAHLVDATESWHFPWRVLNDRDVAGAREHLTQPGRLAVIASETENSPYVVLECLAAGVPFLAPDVGGIAELVAEDDRGRTLYPRGPGALAAALRRALAVGVEPARPRLPFDRVEKEWLLFQAELRPAASAPLAAPALRPLPPEGNPIVTVCIGTFNRPNTLADAIRSIEEQTYPDIEVVLVDDCSTLPAAKAYLEALTPRFEARGWRVLRNEVNSWQGVTRHRAVAASKGKYLLFMDDDNYAWPDEVEMFVRVAEHTGAQVLTCLPQPFEGGGPPPSHRVQRPPIGWLPVGPCAAFGVYDNGLGDANMFMTRDAWDRLGGFTKDRAYFEDWEFLQTAALAGLPFECIPEALFCYRIWPGAQTASVDVGFLYRSYARVLRPTLAAVPEALRPAVEYAFESHLREQQRQRVGYWGRGRAPGELDARLHGVDGNSAEAFAAAAEAALGAGQQGAARALAEQALRLSPHHRAAKGLLQALG